MSVSIDHDNRYRWYCCKEDNESTNHWICQQIDAREAINTKKEKRELYIPIVKRVPQACDFLFINNALKPTFEVKESRGTQPR